MSDRAGATFRGRLSKLTITLAVFGPLLLFSPTAAQDKQPSARKFDEFGDILMTEIKARLDNLAAILQNEPRARGFIIVYRSRRDLPGLSNRLAHLSRKYMLDNRGVPEERLVTVDGGEAMCLTQELWVVDPGAAPKRRDDAYSRSYTNTRAALKFDEFYYPLPWDNQESYDGPSIGDTPEALEAFATALREQPRAQAYVIAYKQYDAASRHDPPSAAQRMLREVRRNLVRVYGISPSRIKTVDGGYRVWRQVELWLLPRGVHPPVATPNAFPRRR
jgi:hypothetical protein